MIRSSDVLGGAIGLLSSKNAPVPKEHVPRADETKETNDNENERER